MTVSKLYQITHVGYGPRSAHKHLKGRNDSKMSSSHGRVERVWYENPYRAEDREKFPEFESELKDHLEAEMGIKALLWHANCRRDIEALQMINE